MQSPADCDNTLKHSLAFFAAHQLDTKTETLWLKSHGGFCDCEVLLNVRASIEAEVKQAKRARRNVSSGKQPKR